MVSEKKKKRLDFVEKELADASVIGIVNMRKLPTRQLQKIKKDLAGRAKIVMARKSLLTLALKKTAKTKKNVDLLVDCNAAVPAIIISKEDPFKLYAYLKKNKSPAAAKAGDIATSEITANKGPTSMQPGPAMTQLQAVGLKTGVEGGKIAIMKDAVIAKAGDKITPEMAAVFSMLGLEPMRIGIDVVAMWKDGITYNRDVLDIDEEQFYNDVVNAVQHGINLSVNAGYLTTETAPIALQKAFREARSLAIVAGVMTPEVVGDLLAKAAAEMKALLDKLGNIETKTVDAGVSEDKK